MSSSLTTHVNVGLVALSVATGVLASYAALDLMGRSGDATRSVGRLWIAGAGVTMGAGIWSMHFIGMLALRMSMPVSYDDWLVALSFLVAVLGAGVSLAMVTRPGFSRSGLPFAAAFMGFAIAAMHYLGMASMHMHAVIHWQIALVILSVAVGLIASLIALSLLMRMHHSSDGFGFTRRAAAAVLLGCGVAGLHYIAMQASSFTAASGHAPVQSGFSTNTLVVMLSLAAVVMLAALIGGAALDQRRAAIAADIAIVANIARELCRVGDARGRICDAVQRLTFADRVTILEPDADDGLRVTAGGPRLSADEPVHRETMMLDGRYVGVLEVGWSDRARRLSERTKILLEMVAAEAAVAIDREALLNRLELLSRRDELTGLLNRRVLGEELQREMAVANRHNRPLCLVMLDLDHFKAYNDSQGHPAGDRLLRATAEAWVTQLRGTDLIARYGGEEFLVILPDCGLEDAVCTADRLRTAVPEGATCSAGIACLKRFDTASTLIARADRALYDAKAQGRDRTSTEHRVPLG